MDLQYVIVKLMVNVAPFIYRDEHEEEARARFTKALDKNKGDFQKLILNDENPIPFKKFKAHVRQIEPSAEAISDMNIECAYVMLCRGIPHDRLHTVSEETIKECILGFKKEDIVMLFNAKAANPA